jgi:hypothetical protein
MHERPLSRTQYLVVFEGDPYSSLKATDIPYTLLSDSHLAAAKAFHIAYHVDPETLAKQKQFGIDLDMMTGEPLHELPVPSGADALWIAAAPYATSR